MNGLNTTRPRLVAAIGGIALNIVVSGVAFGAIWSPVGGSTDWFVPANWSSAGGTIPASPFSTIISSPLPGPTVDGLLHPGATAESGAVTVGTSTTSGVVPEAGLTIKNGGVLDVFTNNGFPNYFQLGNGTVSVTGSSSKLSGQGPLLIGQSTTSGASPGTFNIQDDGVVSAGALSVGVNQTGNLNIENGGVLTVASITTPVFGVNSESFIGGSGTVGGHGTVTVSGTRSQLNLSGGLFVGAANGTEAILTVNSGGSVSAFRANIGAFGPGLLTVDGGSVSTSDVINIGSSVHQGSGDNGGFLGTVTVTGSASSIKALQIIVGANNSPLGKLNILNGATVTTGGVVIGDGVITAPFPSQRQGTGTVLVNGGTLNAGSFVAVGQYGTGTLTVQNGGTVIANVITSST